MKRILFALTIVFALCSSALATDITIASSTVSGANLPTAGAARSVTVTATSGSAVVTSSAAFPASLVGVSGWKLAISGTDYEVLTATSTSSITLSSNFSGSTASYTATIYPLVLLRIYSNKPFTPYGASYVVQSGSPATPNGFWVQYGCSIISGSLYIPTLTLPSMLDSANAQDRTARYSAYFFSTSGAQIRPYTGFESFQVPASPTTTTWPLLATYNAPASTYQLDMYTYSRDQIAALLANLILTNVTTAVTSKTSNYTLTSTDVLVYAPSGTFTITLPAAASNSGKLYVVKNSGSGVITLATTGGDLIEGYASGSITLIQYDTMILQSTGSTWVIVSYS